MNMNMLRSIGNSITSVESAPKREERRAMIFIREATRDLYV